MVTLNVEIRIKEETKKYTTFYIYINRSQSLMTLNHQDFRAFCGLLTKGQVGMSLDNIEYGCVLEWI